MISEEDIANLRQGSIVLARLDSNSSGTGPIDPHWVMLFESNEQIEEINRSDRNRAYYGVVLSHSTEDPFLVKVPPMIGLDGYFQCSFTPIVHELSLMDVWRQKLVPPDLIKVISKIREAARVRKAK